MTVELGHDPFPPLAFAALATRHIALTTSVAVAFPRSPTVIASQAWDLHANSSGRFVLGLGSQVKGHNERRFGIAWSPPAPRLRDYVLALRAIWRCWETGGPLDYQGAALSADADDPGFFARNRPGCHRYRWPSPPLARQCCGSLARYAMGCGCIRCARADISRKYACRRFDEGMRRGGRDRRHFDLHGGGFVVTGPERGGGGCRRRSGPSPCCLLRLNPDLPPDPGTARARRSRAQAASLVGRAALGRNGSGSIRR